MLVAWIVAVRSQEGESQGDIQPSAGGKPIDRANDALKTFVLRGRLDQMDPDLVWS